MRPLPKPLLPACKAEQPLAASLPPWAASVAAEADVSAGCPLLHPAEGRGSA